MKALTVYAPALIPYESNCKAGIGESPLTVEQIKRFQDQFRYYNLIDKNHSIFNEFKTYGKVVWDSISTKEKTYKVKDTNGIREVTYPVGTWFLEIEITDPSTIEQIENGELTGLSCSWTTQAVIDLFEQEKDFNKLIKVSNHDIETTEVILDDIPNPICFCVSLVDKPCYEDCLFLYEWEFSKNNDKTNNGDTMSKIKKFIQAMNKKADKEDGSDSEKIKELEDRVNDIEEAVEKIIDLLNDEEEEEEEEEESSNSNDEEEEEEEETENSTSDKEKIKELEEEKKELEEKIKKLKKESGSKNSNNSKNKCKTNKCGKQLSNSAKNSKDPKSEPKKSGTAVIHRLMRL